MARSTRLLATRRPTLTATRLPSSSRAMRAIRSSTDGSSRLGARTVAMRSTDARAAPSDSTSFAWSAADTKRHSSPGARWIARCVREAPRAARRASARPRRERRPRARRACRSTPPPLATRTAPPSAPRPGPRQLHGELPGRARRPAHRVNASPGPLPHARGDAGPAESPAAAGRDDDHLVALPARAPAPPPARSAPKGRPRGRGSSSSPERCASGPAGALAAMVMDYSMTSPTVTFPGRILFLTEDPALLESQLGGKDLALGSRTTAPRQHLDRRNHARLGLLLLRRDARAVLLVGLRGGQGEARRRSRTAASRSSSAASARGAARRARRRRTAR